MARISDQAGRPGPAAAWVGVRPRMASASVEMSKAVYQETELSYREAEGARIRTAQINGCMICGNWRLNRDLPDYISRVEPETAPNINARRGREPDATFYEAVDENWRDSPIFNERERLAIEFAERVGAAPKSLQEDDAFWERMHAHYSDGEIVDLTYSVTTWIATGRFLHVLELDTVCPSNLAAMAAAA
jgi:alkylhydroperoxidase family enzyme